MRTRQAFGAALLRVTLGVIFVMHGYYAWAVLGPQGTADLIMRIGYAPALADLLAWFLMVAHTAGGLFLILGLLTVWAALAQVPIMASAVFLVNLDQGFFMKGVIVDAVDGRAVAAGYEFPLLVLVATITVILIGPGMLSIDGARLGLRLRQPIP